MRNEEYSITNRPPEDDGLSIENLSEADRDEQILEKAEQDREAQGGFGVEKNITVIFATIGGFEVPSGVNMDTIEEARAHQEQLNVELAQIITKYGGMIDKIQGGFFMADFGTKVTNTDDPARAVLAAIEMVQTVETFATEKFPGIDIHIGINSGMAWVGEIGAGGDFTDVTVMGPTVNLGARVKTKAGHNQIVVSPNTSHLTEDLFIYKALPPEYFKGIADPVPIFALEGKKPESERITTIIETEEERQRRLQEAIPPHLREKIDAARLTTEGERKIVTMLYSDLSGFTALSEKFQDDPGTMALLMDRCHHSLGRIIYKYEGVIDRIVGDALMAIFGAPITHEDDPERAVQAGLEMLVEIKRFSEQMAVEMGMPPLDVHLGINTGRISIGNISTDATAKMDYTVIGEPVELAEKLEDISDTGEMLVGDRTYRLTRALFDYEKKADVEVGGKLVPVYKVHGKKEDPQLKRGVAALNQVFVARDEVFDILKLSADHLFEGKGHFVCTIGQAGLGKSRLKYELKLHLAETVSWLEGACFAHTEQTAYSVFIATIKAYLDIQESDSDEEIEEKLSFKVKNLFRHADEDLSEEIIPYIGSQLLSLHFEGERGDKIRYLDAEGRRQRTFAAVKDFLIAESKRRPVVLALEDLHWIDQVSLDLIFFLMETMIDEPILVNCLYRSERTDPCWTIAERAIVRVPENFTQVALDPLSPEASRDLLERLLTLEDAEELKENILARTGGNPFYMEEILRSLIDDQIIIKVNPGDPNDSRWAVVQDVEEIDVPDSLEQMMGARIDRMPDEPKAVLQRGAVIGRTFESDILEKVSSGLGHLEEHLARLTATDMISPRKPPTDPPEYIFGHIVTHKITYDKIPGVQRRGLHTQVGSCMEAKHQEHLERIYEQLAQHYHEGNDEKKAVTYLVKSGTKAKRQYNNGVALTFYQQALEHLEQRREDMPEERLEIRQGLGDVNTILGEFGAAIENYAETLQSTAHPVKRAELKRKMANVYEKRAEYDVAMETSKAALDELKAQPDQVEEARIYNTIGWIHSKKGEFDAAIEMATHALELVENSTEYDVIAAIDKNLGTYYYRKGDIARTNEYFQKGIERADQIGDKMLMAQLYNNLGLVGQLTGEMDTAVENLQKSIQLKEQLGDVMGLTTSYGNLALIYLATDAFDVALEYLGKALKISQRTGAQEKVAEVEGKIGSLYFRQKDFDRATEHYLASLEIRQKIGDAMGIAESYINLVEAALGNDDLEAAENYALTALGTAQLVGVSQAIAHAHKNMGLVEKRKGSWDMAKGYFQEAAEIAERAGAKVQLAEAYRYIGEVSLELK
ncbi:MAG: tetratricopeptide repeat protein, partial [Candidatus Poribacteria bacterium]|nr:tetratricopeptide repeat protein [Candidatus Poribacteria bacterium]